MKKTVLISAVSAILLHCTAWAQTTVTVDYDNYSTPAAMQLRRTLAEMQSSGMPYSIAMTVNGDPCTGNGIRMVHQSRNKERRGSNCGERECSSCGFR